ncbi:MAG: FAD-dependent oxidoreductase [Pseudomonadota bacterium]
MPPPLEEPVLLIRCAAQAAPDLNSYLEGGGFVGANGAADMSPLEVITTLRDAALRERGTDGQPVFLKWFAYRQGQGQGCLVVDARQADPHALTNQALIQGNPFGLLEGLSIAALALGARRARVLLPPASLGQESFLQAALGRFLHDRPLEEQTPALELEFVDDAAAAGAGRVLWHSLETWHQITLVFILGVARFLAQGMHGQGGTRLITVGGQVNKPGLVEVPMGAHLWQVLDAAGGLKDPARFHALSLDQGLSGFLSLEAAATPLAPEELISARVNPGFGTLWALGEDSCLVDQTRRALWHLARQAPPDGPPDPGRGLTLQALRLVVELLQRRAGAGHLERLAELAQDLQALGAPAAWPLASALSHFAAQWLEHQDGRPCAVFDPAKPRLAPCHGGCPAGIDIPSFLALVGQGRHAEAVAVIRQDNPLPYTCGLICPAPCEGACLRGELDQAISIRAMKAVAAQGALAAGGYPRPALAPASGLKAAVVGAGPAGLSVAYYLALKGHQVTIFEAQPEVGGTMFLGIPAYRLPRQALAADVAGITDLGVEIKLNQSLGKDFSLEDLREQGFGAIFLGIGAHCGYSLGLQGEQDYPQVLDAITFLRGVALGDLTPPADAVVVVGGGNAAMDAARTCLRLGSSRVTIAYRRTRQEMPAHHEEVEQALAEGVSLALLTVPKEIQGQDGRMTGLVCQRAELGPPDSSGRCRPVLVPDSDFVIKAGAVIAAIGQEPEMACLGALAEDRGVCSRTILAHPATGQTTVPWLFAGGDAVTGPDTVVAAVAAGKRAALAMDAFLGGLEPAQGLEPARPRQMVPPLPLEIGQRGRLARPAIPLRPGDERAADFLAVELGLDAGMALNEAQRCLRCDLCIGCGLCQVACAEMGPQALVLEPCQNAERLVLKDFSGPSRRCIACGACAAVCPTGAARLVDGQGRRRMSLAGAAFQEMDLETCSACGLAFITTPQRQQLEGRLEQLLAPASAAGQRLCPACARRRQGEERWGRQVEAR